MTTTYSIEKLQKMLDANAVQAERSTEVLRALRLALAKHERIPYRTRERYSNTLALVIDRNNELVCARDDVRGYNVFTLGDIRVLASGFVGTALSRADYFDWQTNEVDPTALGIDLATLWFMKHARKRKKGVAAHRGSLDIVELINRWLHDIGIAGHGGAKVTHRVTNGDVIMGAHAAGFLVQRDQGRARSAIFDIKRRLYNNEHRTSHQIEAVAILNKHQRES